MNLYLTYRPKELSDVAGQDHIVTTLKNAIERDQISHAYLFCGMRGTGKTSVARIMAKTILTRGIEDQVLREQVLREIANDALVDFVEIDAASNRRIDDIRELIEKLQFSPIVTKAKVYIIDEVHMLTKDAFNALLKTLEEPPPYAYFILATTELHKVPETIQSRCQRFLFKRVRNEDIVARLRFIAEREKIPCDDDAFALIASYAEGSFRDAISLLDQLRALDRIRAQDVVERTGNSKGNVGGNIVDAIDTRNMQSLTSIISEIEASNTPIEVILSEALTIYRNRVRRAAEENGDPLVFIRPIDTLLKCLQDARMSPLPIIVVESALLSLIGADERREEPAVPAHSAPASTPLPQAEERKEERHATLISVEELTLSSLKQQWSRVIEKTTPAHVRMSLKNAILGSVEGTTVVLIFPSTFHRDKVVEGNGTHSVEQILREIFKREIRLKCILQKDEVASAVPVVTDTVQAAEEVFGAM